MWLAVRLALVLLVLVPAYLALRAFQAPTTEVHQVPVWGWAHRGEWDYTVLLKPNTVSGATTAGPGLTYYDNLVEGIEARFSYTFATDLPAPPAPIQGSYEVTAELAAGTLPRERVAIIPKTPLTLIQEGGANLELALTIDREAYLARLEELAAEVGAPVGSDPTVTYTARVEVTATGPEGEVRQVLEPALVVPLSGQTFTISGQRSLDGHGTVRRSETRPRPGVTERQRNSLIATGLAALLALLIALLTPLGARRQPSREEALARQARSITRKYRKRLAQAALGHTDLPGSDAVPVAVMADLARVSEELLKPVVYRPPMSAQEPHVIYITVATTTTHVLITAGTVSCPASRVVTITPP